ncbi:hypothetical protein MIV054L [Invertebrate iridescent virus 3]|uniref:Uncharacterized protein 054L n=1 Tax=Invertebrate iridescent virus 3 TaxID=345201 RepID=054L_IIV3|nr:hypothetical protein MIV054L [Invertebrate iridescent virus 3]Q197A6.1 RecName: Full=Uncharacterized protein 054L [Invertebrate iridescent virus 3]ABF82084.1 hypothetical protein MIV054L [Invertebrate iridescent virus 3]
MASEATVESVETKVESPIVESPVDQGLLESIKNFMDDLAVVTENENFQDYHTIVRRIDETKVKSYNKLVGGFREFFSLNKTALMEGNFEGLIEPHISYKTESGSFFFNFQTTYLETDEANQEIIKEHLNHIWAQIRSENKCPEQLYIDEIFQKLKNKDQLTMDDQLIRDLFTKFQTANFNVTALIRAGCSKAREFLTNNGSQKSSSTFRLIETIENVNVDNFTQMDFMALISKISAIFSESGESNPLNLCLSSLFGGGNTNQPSLTSMFPFPTPPLPDNVLLDNLDQLTLEQQSETTGDDDHHSFEPEK